MNEVELAENVRWELVIESENCRWLPTSSCFAGAVQLNDALKQVRGVDEQHVLSLFKHLDTAGRGMLAVADVASAIYGDLSDAQVSLVRQAFQVRNIL